MTTANPKKLGRYEVLEELGRGAMGVVFLARDPVIHRQVALKTFRTGPEIEPRERKNFRERFLMEARSCGRLNHPNIVTIHDVVELAEEDAGFMAMEYVRGTNLKMMMRLGKLDDLEGVASIVRQVASALDYAHGAGVVHRDVKPANILLTEDSQAKLTDFGIARLNTSNLTHDGQLIGTPNYMSPEQIRGITVDHRTDIFSFGVVLYEMLTHKKPFQADNLTAVTYRIVNEPFQPIRSVLGALPQGIGAVLEGALAKDPADRYASAGEVAEALDAAIAASRTPEDEKAPVAESWLADAESEEEGLLGAAAVVTQAMPAEVLPTLSELPELPEVPESSIESTPAVPGAVEAVSTASPEPDGEAAQGKGRLDGVLSQTMDFLDRTIPPEARPPRRRLAIYGSVGVALLVIGLITVGLLRNGLRPGAEDAAAEDRLRWSSQVSELMVTGARQLDTGDVQSALGAFQQASQLLDQRRAEVEAERSAAVEEGAGEKAQALASQIDDLADREEAVQLALLSSEWRREELFAQEMAVAGVVAALAEARRALENRDTPQALFWAQQALALDPSQEEAQALVREGEARLGRSRRSEIRAVPSRRAQRAPVAVPEQEAVVETEVETEPIPTTSRLVLDFVSELPRGVLLLYLDEEQIFRESFRFVEKGGLFRRQRSRTGHLEKSFTVAPGSRTVRVYVSGARNRPTEVQTVAVDLEPGGRLRLKVQVDEKGRFEASIE